MSKPALVYSDTFWNSLRYLGVARLLIAGILILVLPAYSKRFETGLLQDPALFLAVAGIYVLFAIVALISVRRVALAFHLQLGLQVTADLLFLGLLVAAAGGPRSGFGLLLLTPVAGAAILVTMRWALFIAAAATLILLGNSFWLSFREEVVEPGFFAASATGIALFALAAVVNRLSIRATEQEARARRRGADLRTQLQVNQMIIAELADGVVIFNRDGSVRVMNRAAQQMLGSVPQIENSSIATTATGFLPSGPGWGIISEHLRLWQAAGTPNLHAVEALLTGSSTIQHHSRSKRVRLKFQAVQSVSEQSEPSQDFVLIIEDFDRIEQQAQQLKLASMGRLSASIAHEIRNPLGAIRHANSLLDESLGGKASPSQQRMHKMIEDNSVRINRIIEDILAISRRERPAGDAIDLALFFADFLPEFIVQYGCPDDAIELEILELEPMRFDAVHLHQILVNLLSNALRYCSKNKGSVVVIWQKSRVTNFLELIVADDGPGVPAQIMPSLFEPFATTEHKGTGLGLYLARELCEINAAGLRYEPDVRRALDSRLSHNWPAKGAFIIAVPVT